MAVYALVLHIPRHLFIGAWLFYWPPNCGGGFAEHGRAFIAAGFLFLQSRYVVRSRVVQVARRHYAPVGFKAHSGTCRQGRLMGLAKIIWFRRVVIALACTGVAFALYIFSFGPVTRFCGANANTGFDDLPFLVRFIYAPRAELMKPGVLPNIIWQPINQYDAWWIGAG
jgi:hypothetical protein